MAQSATPAAAARRQRLVLHLDLNKTLIMSDPASNATMQQVLNGIIASSAFGAVFKDPTTGALSWALSPEHPTLHVTPPAPELVSYYHFCKEIKYPYTKPSSDASPDELAALRLHNTRQKDSARDLVTTFAEEGQPGRAFNGLLKVLEAKMRIPEELKEPVVASNIRGLASGSRFLLPSYFALLRHLMEALLSSPSSSSFDFKVVFRTFGFDSAEVTEEHNAFAAGRHPLYPNPFGETSKPSLLPTGSLLVRSPQDTGAISRAGFHSRDTKMAAVVHRSDNHHHHHHASTTASTGDDGDGDSSDSREGGVVRMLTGHRDIHDFIVSQHRPRVLALQDDYNFWFAHAEKGKAGKLMPIALSRGVAARALAAVEGKLKAEPAASPTTLAELEHEKKAFQWSLGHSTSGDGGVEELHLFFDDNIGSEGDAVRLVGEQHLRQSEDPLQPLLPIHIGPSSSGDHFTPLAALRGGAAASLYDADSGIVDARDLHGGVSVPFKATQNVHLARVDCLSAILNEGYFVELAQLCRRNYERAQAEAEAATITALH